MHAGIGGSGQPWVATRGNTGNQPASEEHTDMVVHVQEGHLVQLTPVSSQKVEYANFVSLLCVVAPWQLSYQQSTINM